MYCTVLLCYVTLRYVMLCYAMSCYVMLRTDMHTYVYIYMNILNGVYKPTYKNKHHLTWKATMTAGRSTLVWTPACLPMSRLLSHDPEDGAQLCECCFINSMNYSYIYQ